MEDAPELGRGMRLDFNAPLSAQRAGKLVDELAARNPATVLDLGCGWGELLLLVLAAVPGARGMGIDLHGPNLIRARENATARDLAQRVQFVEADASSQLRSADLVMNVGAHHAFGDVPQALRALRGCVNPGGRLLFATEIWERPPTAQQLAGMWPGTTAEDCTDLAGLVELAVTAGLRPLSIETATRDEWERFESGFAADAEEWLLANGDHPQAAALREKIDKHRSYWLRGYRDVMGFAYLILG